MPTEGSKHAMDSKGGRYALQSDYSSYWIPPIAGGIVYQAIQDLTAAYLPRLIAASSLSGSLSFSQLVYSSEQKES